MPVAYSNTPLAKKLGLKEGFKILLFQQPKHYFDLFSNWPDSFNILEDTSKENADFIHIFCSKRKNLEAAVNDFKPRLKKTGMLWISWPKSSSEIPTDLKREPVRSLVLSAGLVDVKVASIDKDWSGLKFVYRVKDRW